MCKIAKAWCVYILHCADGTLYTGITNDLDARVVTHNRGAGARYTRVRSRRPVKVVYQELADDRSSASKREYAIKQLNRQEKLRLVNSPCPALVPIPD